jgi:hypothetical protein
MTSLAQLVAGLEGRGIILSLADGQLRYRSPKDALTGADRAAIAARRGELLDFLAARDAGRALRMATPVQGPFTASVAQQMYYRFGAGPLQGKPVSLNIGMAGRFANARAADVADAIRVAVARHETLRTRIVRHGEVLELALNRAEDLDIGFDDASGAADGEAAAQAVMAQVFGDHIAVESPWLFRARVVALPGGDAAAVMAANHFNSDGGTRNILVQEIQDALDLKAGRAVVERPAAIAYNDFSLGERRFLESAQGIGLIDYWRRWYGRQPVMAAPSGSAMVWGAGTRIVNNFTIPRRVLQKARALAAAQGVTPFLVFLGIFSLAMARWSRMERFPVRVLGDKRARLDLAGTVGLMFCADPVEIAVPADQDFAALLRAILTAYEAALAQRLPTLHYFAPHVVRPDIEAADYPNRIPAVFNYYSGGTADERARGESAPDTTASLPWPPRVTRLAPQRWTRQSAPLFLHLMDLGSEMNASLHFLADVVSEADEKAFIDTLLRVFGEILPV